MGMYILLFMVSWALSFVCSGFEIGFLTVNELKVNALAKQKSGSAKILSALLKNKEKVLATLLIGNTSALVLLTFAFSKIVLSVFTQGFPASIETVVLTALVFTTCELFPKSLFRIYSFELTCKLSYFIFAMYFVFTPITLLFMAFSRRIKKNDESAGADYKLHEVAAEGARRRLLPLGVPVLVKNFSDKNLTVKDVCKNVRPTIYSGNRTAFLKSTQFMDEVIKEKILWNYDTLSLEDDGQSVYYPSVAVLDAFFKTCKI